MNSFGFGGANAHVVISDPDPVQDERSPQQRHRPCFHGKRPYRQQPRGIAEVVQIDVCQGLQGRGSSRHRRFRRQSHADAPPFCGAQRPS
ncbi:hypothetical protein LP421_16300 [Rhizobium sp. RCAM05350]|nr:hypothetical protein LP421_16300 [Rhizobium sp. RCAM05350]